MISLAMDTCDARGSVALRLDGVCRSIRIHEADDYSNWLLPAADAVLQEAGCAWPSVGLLAVATGPGSFTGVRIGLTAVKGWAEVYRKRIVGVSRLEAMARIGTHKEWLAPLFDAHRGQVFGALYRRNGKDLQTVEPGLVIAPSALLTLVQQRVGAETVEWPTLDPDLIVACENWAERAEQGDVITPCRGALANAIGELAEERAARGEFTDTLTLDANYVRRSDAEIFWKSPAHVQECR